MGVFTWRLHLSTHHSVALSLLRGISLALSETSYDALLYARHPHEGGVEPTYFLDGRVDAVILAPGGLTEAGVASLAASGLPGVLLYEREAPGNLASVSIDNMGGVSAAMDHLVRLGHRRIGFVGPLYSRDFRERLAAYEHSLARHGLARQPRWVATDVTETDDVVADAVRCMIRAEEPPTALVAGNDGIALSVLAAARGLGLGVPGDLSVVGFDGSDAGRLANLTTIAQPAENVGATAARYVADLLGGRPGDQCRSELPVRFVARETTGPPAYV